MLDFIGILWVLLGAELFLTTQAVMVFGGERAELWLRALPSMLTLVLAMAGIRFSATPLKNFIETLKKE